MTKAINLARLAMDYLEISDIPLTEPSRLEMALKYFAKALTFGSDIQATKLFNDISIAIAHNDTAAFVIAKRRLVHHLEGR